MQQYDRLKIASLVYNDIVYTDVFVITEMDQISLATEEKATFLLALCVYHGVKDLGYKKKIYAVNCRAPLRSTARPTFFPPRTSRNNRYIGKTNSVPHSASVTLTSHDC